MIDSVDNQNTQVSDSESRIPSYPKEPRSIKSAKSSTPYDDAWRTLTMSASRLLIPMVNEAFGEHFSEKAEVILSPNEHLFSTSDGKTEKRITDTNFSIADGFGGSLLGDGFAIVDGSLRKHYLFECESKPVSGRILVRIVEYAVKTGLEEGRTEDRDTVIISIPQAAILSLRCMEHTPDTMRIILKTEEGQIGSTVQVMKLADYTPDSVFLKKLYLLIPFLLFNYEKRFEQIQEDDGLYQALLYEYTEIFNRIDALIAPDENGDPLIDVYTSKALRAMTHAVVNGLAENYPRIREGVNAVVGGNIIMFDALKIKLEGLREGEQKGLQKGKIVTLYECVRDGDIPLQKAAKRAGMNEADFIRDMNAAGYQLPQENRA